MSAAEHREILRQLARIRELEDEARATPDYPEYSPSADVWDQVRRSEQWLAVLKTRQLRRLAARLLVAFPAQDEDGMYKFMDWDDDEDESPYLTDRGFTEVRSRIREEQRHRREVWGFWIASVTGVIGALIGLGSVLMG